MVKMASPDARRALGSVKDMGQKTAVNTAHQRRTSTDMAAAAGGEVEKPHQRPRRAEQNQAHGAHGEVADDHELPGVGDRLVQVLRAHALADDRHHCQADCLSGDVDHAGNAVGNAVGGHGGGAEGGDEAEHNQLARLEEAVLQAVGDADGEDAPDHNPVELGAEESVNPQNAVGPLEQEEDDYRRRNAGDQRADARAQRAHAVPVDQNGVDRDIDDVYDQGVEHGHPAVAHGAEKGRAGVVDGHEGVGQGGGDEVGQGAVHHVGLNLAEDQREHMLPEDQRQHHQRRGHHRHGVEQLLGGGPGMVRLTAAQVLGYHHRAAGGQGGENLDEQYVDIIHQ